MQSPTPVFTRRRLIQGGLAITAALTVSDIAYETHHLTVTQHAIRLPGLKAPCRVVQLSDMHRSWCVSEAFLDGVVARANSLKPDVIALTGDFVTRYSDFMRSCTGTLRKLHAPLGMYAVMGNHDAAADDWQGRPVVIEALQSIGIQVFINGNTMLPNGLRIVGVDDRRTGDPQPELAFRGVHKGEAVLAMTHNPLLFPDLCRYDAIVLAGHTHGGQINVPGVTGVLLGNGRMHYKHGWYKEPTGPGRLYVTRGVGIVGVPFRFHAPPEISVFDLQPA